MAGSKVALDADFAAEVLEDLGGAPPLHADAAQAEFTGGTHS